MHEEQQSAVQQPANPGSVAKGVLLNISLNLFLGLLLFGICASGGYRSDWFGVAAAAAMFFGLVQLVHVIPLWLYFRHQQQPLTARGILNAALVILALWFAVFGICAGMIYL